MMARLRYPTGVRPLLIDATARRRRAESRIVCTLERAGFAEVVVPILDYAEWEEARLSYRFVDRDGELVAIRSDFTPLVARALAPSIEPDTLPLRVFYRGDVIRYEPSRLGADREIFQIGAEIVGDGSVAADLEVLSLVASILGAFNVRPMVVYTDATIPERIGPDVREILTRKDTAGLNERPLVKKLAGGDATLDDLRAFAGTADIAERLAAISDATDFVLHLDDVDRSPGYYSGLRFRAYDGTSRAVIAQGGRYDTLYGRFGASAPAVGFTITVDVLEQS